MKVKVGLFVASLIVTKSFVVGVAPISNESPVLATTAFADAFNGLFVVFCSSSVLSFAVTSDAGVTSVDVSDDGAT